MGGWEGGGWLGGWTGGWTGGWVGGWVDAWVLVVESNQSYPNLICCIMFLQPTTGIKMAYNYTKPRRPIAAMYTSPGPCYALPSLMGQTRHDPRSIHTKVHATTLVCVYLSYCCSASNIFAINYIYIQYTNGRIRSPIFSHLCLLERTDNLLVVN